MTKSSVTKTVRTEAQCKMQQKNFCIFLIRGAQGQSHFLSRQVSLDLLDELEAVHQKILTQLGAHHNGKA